MLLTRYDILAVAHTVRLAMPIDLRLALSLEIATFSCHQIAADLVNFCCSLGPLLKLGIFSLALLSVMLDCILELIKLAQHRLVLP